MTDVYVTREDLRQLRDDLVTRMVSGFAGTHQRLDLINGRVGRNEVIAAQLDTKVENIEREVFDRSRHIPVVAPVEDERKGITRRDIVMIGFGGAGVIAAWKFVEWAVGMLRQLP